MTNIKALFILVLLILLFGRFTFAQETEAAASSALTGITLPTGAQRVRPGSVPVEISGTLDRIIDAANGRVRKGGTEVLVWADGDYSKAKAGAIIERLTAALRTAGWQYSVEGTEDGVTVFSLLTEKAGRRAVVGFYTATDEALLWTWMEILTGNAENVQPATDSTFNLAGSWDNGSVSTVMRQEQYTGAVSPGRSSRFEYNFTPDGRFSFTGLLQTVNYSCTDTLYNEKNGKYVLNGSTLTLIPARNFWRKTNSCNAGGNSERNYTLEKETYRVSAKTDEYGKELICLADDKGETCYRRKQ